MSNGDVLDPQGKTVHYSRTWEPVVFTNGIYSPKKSFRLYCENSVILKVRGAGMKRSEAYKIGLTEGYHNFVCTEIISDTGADDAEGVHALF